MDVFPMSMGDINITRSSTRNGPWVNLCSKPSLLNGLLVTFDRGEQKEWFELNWSISIYFVLAYIIFIHLGVEWMKSRKPFQLQGVMVLWNSALALFSICACTKVLPEFLGALYSQGGFYKTVCNSIMEVTDESLYWGWLFTLSKIVELGDTVFLILRKRNLIFLHWYHHITVLLYCWYSYSDQISPARWFICVNYTIHAMMYTYYALRSLHVRIPQKIAMLITSLQLSQMVIGVIVNVYAYQMIRDGRECGVSRYHLHLGFIMYASYFILFAQFFRKAYLTKDKPKKLLSVSFVDENGNVLEAKKIN